MHRFPLLRHLGDAEARQLASQLFRRQLERGAVLFRQDDPADHLVFVLSGQVKLERTSSSGTVSIVEVLGPGNVLAAANFLAVEPYPVTAVALSPVDSWTLSYRDFETTVRRSPDISLALLRYVATRLHRAYTRAPGVQRSDVRLASALARIAQDSRTDGGNSAVVALSHEDLSQVAGMARETATRHLAKWQKDGLVRLHPRAIQVLDLKALRRIGQVDDPTA